MEHQKLLKKKKKALKDRNETLLCAACSDLADYYIREEQFSEAIKEYEILAEVYKKQKKIIDLATVNRGMGEAYMLLTEYEKSIKHQEIYLELSREQENLIEEQRALATLGHTFLTKFISGKGNKSDLNLAYRYSMKSLDICERLQDIKRYNLVDMTSRLYNNLGMIQEYLGHHDKSMELFKKAIALCKANDVFECLFQAYNSLASVLERRGDYHTAIKNYKLAIETAKKIKDKNASLCDCFVSKATILFKLGDLQAAKKSLHKAYKLKLPKIAMDEVKKKLKIAVTLYRTEKELVSKSLSDAELQKYYEKMGDGFSKINCFEKSIEYYHKMLDVAMKTDNNLPSCYYSLAATYRDDEQFDKAIEYFEKEYQLRDFKARLDTLCEIADTKETMGCGTDEIVSVYERAIRSCKEISNGREEGRMLGRLIDFLKRTGNSSRVSQYEQQFQNTGFVSSDSEEVPDNEISDDEISLNSLTDLSEDSDFENPSNNKRRSKTFQVRRNLKGETQLHTACISGKTNVVKHLLDQGHPVNVRDNGGWLPLHDACISGHLEVVKLLLDNGAAVNDRGGTHCNGITPLHDAAVNGHLEIMEHLLDCGASVLSKTDDGETAYHYLKKMMMETELDAETKSRCDRLLKRMGAILDAAGQNKEINTNINNSVFVLDKDGNEILDNKYRRQRNSSLMINGSPPETIRNSKTRRVSTSSSSSSSGEDIDRVNISGRNPVVPKSKATNEYKMVMDNLRNKVGDQPPPSNKSISPTKRSAFVVSEENIDDDWLEDDLGTNKSNKRRKISYTDNFINSSNTKLNTMKQQQSNRRDSLETVSSKSSRSSHKSFSKSPKKQIQRTNSSESISTIRSDKMDYACQNDISVVDQYISDNVMIHDSDDDFVVPLSDHSNKQQMSLLEAGFIRCTTTNDMPDRRRTISKRTLQPKITHFGSLQVSQENCNRSVLPEKSHISPIKSPFIDDDPILAMDVNIEGRPFRVTSRMSLKDTLTVKWLALEAARRYSKKEYVEPILELTTKSGAELVDDDPIGTLFITDNQVVEVNARVLKWNLPSIGERYKEACQAMEETPLDSVSEKLDAMTISLDFKNCCIQSKPMAPLCKSLLRENRLLELDLSNNFFSLDCMKLLTSSLPTMENLTKLNLSCTNLHAAEMRILSNMFSNSPLKILTKLYSLDLSENFIKDESLQDISSITKHLNLREINLSLLDFTEELFNLSYNRNASFNFSNIEILNLSCNRLPNTALQKFLSFLDPMKLTMLDVSNNKTSFGFLAKVVEELCKGEIRFKLDELNLSRCSVDDSEVIQLLRSADNLRSLNLSYTEVTSISLRKLLEHPAVKSINVCGCSNIEKYLDETAKFWPLNAYNSEPKSLKINCSRENFKLFSDLWNKYFSENNFTIEEENGVYSIK